MTTRTPTATAAVEELPQDGTGETPLARLVASLAAGTDLRHVLLLAPPAGGRTVVALMDALARGGAPTVHWIEPDPGRFESLRAACEGHRAIICYNISPVLASTLPGEEEVASRYRAKAVGDDGESLSGLLRRLEAETLLLRQVGSDTAGIDRIRSTAGIENFDMAVIDGNTFTGVAALGALRGTPLIVIAGAEGFNGMRLREALDLDPTYKPVAPGGASSIAAYRRRPEAGDLPVHFFTIVLNGEPFIRYHEAMLARLPFRWHWHVVEGVAALRHDTAWSVAHGGKVTDDIHRNGHSIDGTSEYLDDLARRFPAQVTIYRKPPGQFWDGKTEMVNAPIPSITEPCLLWQMDNDELWTVDQVVEMRRRFLAEPDRGAAFYWCWYFVGPDHVISTRNNYAQNPAVEWLRTWRFEPGDRWAAHEPPTLVRPHKGSREATNIASLRPFTQDETESFGCVFQHFAYVTEAQLAFKESYYGYAGAAAQWRRLLAQDRPALLADYFAWVTDRTMFDKASHHRLEPLAQPDAEGRWAFGAPVGAHDRGPVATRPRIVVDGLYWQYLASGIGRVWHTMFEEWVKAGLADHFILLDRAGTAPRIPGVHTRTIAAHDYGRSGADSLYLERICRDLGADLLVSTYYSTPVETPSFFFGHDMIPEMTGIDLSDEGWQEKARAIRHGSGHLMVSRNSARDLAKVFPTVNEEDIAVACNGLPPGFAPAPEAEIADTRRSLGIRGPYVLMVGDRSGAGGYKNGVLAFRAAEIAKKRGLDIEIVCVGGLAEIEPTFAAAAPSVRFRRVGADDATLRRLYSGAHALVYPSRYEGFGMPVLEAMACGGPVITCPNSSLLEVGGEAAIFVDPDDAEAAAEALISLSDPAARAARVAAGLAQAARFTTAAQARDAFAAFTATIEAVQAGRKRRPDSGWREFRTYQAGIQAWLQERPDLAVAALDRARAGGGDGAPARPSGELLRALHEIESMKRSPFWRLRGIVIGALRATGLRRRG